MQTASIKIQSLMKFLRTLISCANGDTTRNTRFSYCTRINSRHWFNILLNSLRFWSQFWMERTLGKKLFNFILVDNVTFSARRQVHFFLINIFKMGSYLFKTLNEQITWVTIWAFRSRLPPDPAAEWGTNKQADRQFPTYRTLFTC